MRTVRTLTPTLLSLLLLLGCHHVEVNEVSFKSHNLKIDINVENNSAIFMDEGLMHVKRGYNLLYLPPNSTISNFFIGDADTRYMSGGLGEFTQNNKRLATEIIHLGPKNDALWVVFKASQSKEVNFKISYEAAFLADVSDVKFSNQNVGREITGTILEKGAYFSPSSYFYPRGDDELMNFKVTANIPENWESISDGNSTSSEVSEGRKIQSWENPYKSDGLMFMAAPFIVGHTAVGDVDIYCYFFEEDTSLFETYLPATAGYMKMYEEMIGKYPYERFTVAENFFPTGYGMPAWTLLGQQVVRLPFIVMTSLGHEVLHNWWGNSIYVDYDNGNWCEGLTVYGADYLYKAKRSSASAKDYRKDILKQYKSYVNAENEFPVRDFKARHNAESRTIGYNKVMMIFHMIENMIGPESFFKAWQHIYLENKGKKVTWEAWLDAYEKTAGEDLSFIIPEWVNRTGAALLDAELVSTTISDETRNIKFKIMQSEESPYTLRVPVRFYGVDNHDMWISLSEPETTVDVNVHRDIVAFEVDPDYNVFRHLYPQEIEPIIAASLGIPEKHFLYMDPEEKGALKAFGDNLTEGDITPVSVNDIISKSPEDSHAFFSLNTDHVPSSMSGLLQVNEKTIIVNGQEFPREGHTFVLAGSEEAIASQFLKVISGDPASLPRIGELIPHYGKYSYLVFKGARNIAKGQWPVGDSPLKITL